MQTDLELAQRWKKKKAKGTFICGDFNGSNEPTLSHPMIHWLSQFRNKHGRKTEII